MTGILIAKAKKNGVLPLDLKEKAKLIAHRGHLTEKMIHTTDFFCAVYINDAQATNEASIKTISKENPQKIFLDGLIAFDGEPIQSWSLFFAGLKNECGKIFRRMTGMFSIVVQDGTKLYAAKDPVGSKPLYYIDTSQYLLFSSELKAFQGIDGIPQYIQPGQVIIYDGEQIHSEFFQPISEFGSIPIKAEKDVPDLTNRLYKLLDDAVKKIIMIPCKVNALLSGGIDSTVICAMAMEYHHQIKGNKLDVYTVAVEGSEDLINATLFAELHADKLNHHIFKMTFDEMLKIIPQVIYSLETFDAALIRSAIPMYYLSSKISSDTGILLTGEGGDELFGGYDYLKTLSPEDLNREFIDFMKIEHATGLQRVDRIPYAFGIEARAPWFDLDIVKLSFEVPIELKLKTVNENIIEKWIARETFKSILPPEITWRKKAKFSEGVGSQFIMRDFLNQTISDAEFEKEREIFPNQFVKSKEELYYWKIFKEQFKPHEDFVKHLPRTSNFIL